MAAAVAGASNGGARLTPRHRQLRCSLTLKVAASKRNLFGRERRRLSSATFAPLQPVGGAVLGGSRGRAATPHRSRPWFCLDSGRYSRSGFRRQFRRTQRLALPPQGRSSRTVWRSSSFFKTFVDAAPPAAHAGRRPANDGENRSFTSAGGRGWAVELRVIRSITGVRALPNVLSSR